MVMGRATRPREPKQRPADIVHRGEHAPIGGDGGAAGVDRRVGAPSGEKAAARVNLMEETAVHRPVASERPADKSGVLHDVESLVGRRVGQYRVDSVLGRGTMAWVFKAKHLGLGRPCALKVMDPSLVARQPGIREQFWAEARAAANLLHPHVVTIHNLGSVQGLHFIEMEYIRGGKTLRESLVRDGPLDAGARLDPGPAGRARARSRARGGPRPPRHQAGQRPSDSRRPSEARRLRAGAPAR